MSWLPFHFIPRSSSQLGRVLALILYELQQGASQDGGSSSSLHDPYVIGLMLVVASHVLEWLVARPEKSSQSVGGLVSRPVDAHLLEADGVKLILAQY